MKEYYRIKLGPTNCYLVSLSEGYLLVDCGGEKDYHSFLSSLSRRGIDIASIKYILITHHHADHCGLLSALTATYPQIGLIASRTCIEYIATGHNYESPNQQYASNSLKRSFYLLNKLSNLLSDSYPPYTLRPNDIIVEEGNLPLITASSQKMVILFTPGHTQDSISLLCGGHAFVGDAARKTMQLLGAPYEPILIDNRTACMDSWRKLIASGVSYVHPAHGNSFSIIQLLKYLKR